MTEVISVEVDGEVDDDGRFSPENRRPPRWGLPVAIAVAGVLFLAVLIMVVWPALTSASNKPNTEPAEGRDATRTARERAPETAPVDPRIDSAAKALAAWGQFAVTGDLGVLEGFFDKEGPQYRALKAEALRFVDDGHGGKPYRVTLSNPSVTSADSGQATITATVVWSRQREVDQAFAWRVVLHRNPADGWLLWTVENT